jgi:hypothetical protein
MHFMVVNAFLNIKGALDVVTRPPAAWSCTLVTAPMSLLGMFPVFEGLADFVGKASNNTVGGPLVRTEGLMGCVKLQDDAEPKTMGKLMKQFGVHTLTGINVPVPLKLFETFQPCMGRQGGKEGLGLVIGTERNLDAALEIMSEVVSGKWAPGLELYGTILGGGGGFELQSKTAMGWPKRPIFVALGGGNVDAAFNWVNSKMPEWQKSVDARVMPNWGDCSLENFGSFYWGSNYDALLAYKKKVDPMSVFRGIQLVGQGDTECWSDDDETQSANCVKAGASQTKFSQAWSTNVKDCKHKTPPYQSPVAVL